MLSKLHPDVALPWEGDGVVSGPGCSNERRPHDTHSPTSAPCSLAPASLAVPPDGTEGDAQHGRPERAAECGGAAGVGAWCGESVDRRLGVGGAHVAIERVGGNSGQHECQKVQVLTRCGKLPA